MSLKWLRYCKAAMELTRSASRPKFTRHLSMENAEEKDFLTVAVCQMNAGPDKEQNYEVCRRLVNKASLKGAKMVFLPEAFDYIAENKEQSRELAEPLDGRLIDRFRNLAKENKIWISLGGFHEKGPENDEKRIHNAHVIISDIGNLVSVYRKIHLFDVTLQTGQRLHESEYVIPGSTILPPVETPIGKVGLGICYDVRFPEFSVALTKMGAEILTYPSAFTVSTGLAHWEVLLRCRAVENQCYVIAAAQTGVHTAKRESYGHAMIVDPWGAVIAQCHEGTDVVNADIDLGFLHKIRRDMPVWFHRKNELYESANKIEIIPIDDSSEYPFGQVSLKGGQLFLRTKFTMAFVNRKPVLPGHVLISPLRIVKRLVDLTREEVSDLFTCVQKVQSVIEKVHEVSSSTIAVQDGVDAGQSIFHVHVHILPRKAGDFERNDQIYEKLQKHDKVEDCDVRTEEDMSAEANSLRQHWVPV